MASPCVELVCSQLGQRTDLREYGYNLCGGGCWKINVTGLYARRSVSEQNVNKMKNGRKQRLASVSISAQTSVTQIM